MKYRNIQIGEVIPKNAEIRSPFTGKFEPYRNKGYSYTKGIPNCIFDPSDLRVPIEEDN